MNRKPAKSRPAKRPSNRLRPAVNAVVLPLEQRVLFAAFTPGDLVVYTIGNGSTALSASGTQVYLNEYTPAGSLVQSLALPAYANATSSTEGYLSLSPDGHELAVPGYANSVSTGNVNVATTNRVVDLVTASGSVDAGTVIPGADFGTGNIRGATADGSNIWVASSANGVRYTTDDSTATSTIIESTVTNTRTVEVANGQLYMGSGSGNFKGVNTVGTGEPTTAGQTVTALVTDAAASPYAFAFAHLNGAGTTPDTVYVADDSSTGGLQKYSLVSGAWVLNGTIGVNSALRGVTASVSGSTVTLYATTGSTTTSGGGSLYAITDTSGYNAAPSNTTLPSPIATVSGAENFRGVAFVPTPVTVAPTITSVTPATGSTLGGNTVTIRGTALDTVDTVTFAGTNISSSSFVSVTPTSITLTVPAHTAGTFNITAHNSYGNSNAVQYLYTAAPLLAFDSPTYTVNENVSGGNEVVTVDETGTSTTPVSVAFTVGKSGDTAVAPTNYGGSVTVSSGTVSGDSGTLVFPANTTSQETITIPIVAANPQGGNKFFTVTLGTASGGVVASPANSVVTIKDESDVFTFNAATYLVNSTNNGGEAEFTVTRSGDTTDTATVQYSFTDGTATNGTAYTGATGILSFAANQTSASFPVSIANNPSQVGNLSFTATLSADPAFTGLSSFGAVKTATQTIVGLPTASYSTKTTAPASTSGDIETGGFYTASFLPVSGSTQYSGSPYLSYVVAEFDPTTTPSVYPAAGSQVTSLAGLGLNFTEDATDSSASAGDYNLYLLSTDNLPVNKSNGLTYSTTTVDGVNGQGGAVLLGTVSDPNTANGTNYTFSPASLSQSVPGSTTVAATILADLNNGTPFNLAIAPSSTNAYSEFNGGSGSLTVYDTVVVNKTQETVSLNSAATSVPETTGTTGVQITRGGSPISDYETVQYTFTDGSAINGTNYSGTSGTAVFAPNATTTTIPFSTIDANPQGGDKAFTLTLSNPQTYSSYPSPATPSTTTVGVLGTITSETVTVTDANTASSEVITEYSSDYATVEAAGPYTSATAGGAQTSTFIRINDIPGGNPNYPSYGALDFNNVDVNGTDDGFHPAATVTAINSLTLNVYNQSTTYDVAGPLNVYLVPDAISNIDPTVPETKDPHFFDSTYGVEGLDTTALPSSDTNTFGTPILLGNVEWTAPNTTGVEVSLPLYQYNAQGQAALVSDINSGTKFRLIVTPENTTVDASWDANEYALSNNAPLAPSLSIGLQEGVVSSLPPWLAPNSVATWNASTHSLVVSGASTIIGNPGTDAPNITFTGTGATLTINTGSTADINIGSLAITGTNSVVMTSTSIAHILVDNGALTASAGNTLNLGNNLLDLVGGRISSVQAEVSNGSIISSDTTTGSLLGTFGIIPGNALASSIESATGVTPAATDVVVRHTYYGDANLDGHVDGSDYTKVDAGFGAHSTGWANGDFNYDGVVDGSDYTLIDNAFNTQGTALPTAVIAGKFSSTAIPSANYVSSVPAFSDILTNDKKNKLVEIVDSVGE